MKIEKLKQQARQHEQREEWGKAMDLYSKALEAASEQDDPEIALHNRMGDLQVRVKDLEGAVKSYEKAIELYLDADLANNAMAVCRKLERSAPGRPTVLHRMGQIRVKQGFVVDARQDFLAYAEIRLREGNLDEALRALEEFTSLAPEDAETRLFLAEHLAQADRPEDAVGYLRQAYGIAVRRGEQERADAIRERVGELDPTADLDAVSSEMEASGPLRAKGGLGGFETTSLSDLELDDLPAPGALSAEPVDHAEEDGSAGFSDDLALDDLALEEPLSEEAGDAPPSSTTAPDGLAAESDVDHGGLEMDSLDGAFSLDDLDAETDPSDGRGPDGEDAPSDRGVELEALPTLDDDPGFSADDAGVDAEDDLEGVPEIDLPLLGESPLEEGPDADAWRRRGVELFEQGADEEAREALEQAHRAYQAAGDPERAMRVVRELIFRDPDEVGHYQRLVEYAHQTGDRTLMVPAFLELAEALVRSGAERKAEAVYGQVLALDPRNPKARQAIIAGVGAGGSGAAAPAADVAGGGGRFVDLGGMILDQPTEDSFRWKVSDTDPTGDEEADFAKMLAQFKEKVATNLPSDDATAHYDLGAAYKEMGLLDEAVGQFQHALRAHPSHLAAYEMVGQCFLDKDEPEMAVRTLRRALGVEHKVEDDLLGIYYFLGQAYEGTGNRESAREFYERVFSLDINFKDVTERLRLLR